MVRIGTPIGDDYIKTNNDELILKLHENGFFPMYRDDNYVYFRKNQHILKKMEELIKYLEMKEGE